MISHENIKRVYQRVQSPTAGDCMRCAVATLLQLDYEVVPDFVNRAWHETLKSFMKDHGYDYDYDVLWNPNVGYLEQPTAWCFTKDVERDPNDFFPRIRPDYGVDGLFIATVYSPKYTDPNEHPISHLHAVLCDVDFNIIHDPNPEYKGIVSYPYSQLIGYNGIRSIDIVRKI